MMAQARAILFDVFGTVVDWHGGVARAAGELARSKGRTFDAGAFALAWREGYAPAMDRVRQGELPWLALDALHRLILDDILPRFGLADCGEAERAALNEVWHCLDPWPDAVDGLTRLKERHVIATLSNGNVALLVDMARHARLPWDMVFSAELFRRYKPDPEVYLGACALLSLQPADVMLCAAHKSDLRAAQKVGLRTAFVRRPREFGPGAPHDTRPDPSFDYNVDSFVELSLALAR